jgi:hypothetical protein
MTNESIVQKLTELGLPADFKICFETVVDLYNEGMILDSELSTVKNLLDFFD